MDSRQRDLTRALDVVRLLHDTDSTTIDPGFVDGLRQLVGCDIATYRETVTAGGHAEVISEVVSGADVAEVAPVWSRYDELRDGDPIPGIGRRVGSGHGAPADVAVRSSDVVPDRTFRRSRFFAEMCRPIGTRYILKLFTSSPTGTVGIVLESAQRDFHTRDLAVMTALAPHLRLAARRRTIVGHDRPALEALTAREREVARLVAGGMSNKEIAAVLFVSPGTVRTHLDHIYAKTGLRNRTALAVEVRSTTSVAAINR